jgi:hypothetical protein
VAFLTSPRTHFMSIQANAATTPILIVSRGVV